MAPYADRIDELLQQDGGLPPLEIFRRLREDGFAGEKSALFDFVAKLRPKNVRPIARFEGLPGEFSQHDFGQVDVEFHDGQTRRTHFFATRMKWSRWVQVDIVPDETAESLVRALVGHFAAMGGVPLIAVFDRPKTIAIEWEKDGRVTQWNATFLQVMAELSVAPELCWPYQPQQKGAVENLVGWVKKSFFRCRRFINEADLRRQLTAWIHEVNTQRDSRATRETPLARMESAERARMRPLRLTPDALFLRYPISVGPDGKVNFDGRRYSMPPNAAGQSGTLYLGENPLRIVAGRWEARHRRLRGDERESTLPEHRVAMVGAVKGPRAKLYLKRQYLQDLGPEAVHFLTELIHRPPQQWAPDVERLHEMLQLHGDAAVLDALRRSNAAGLCGAEYVAHHLGELRLRNLVTDGEAVSQ